MTFQQYIDNPLGKHNAVFSQRNELRQIYTAKLDSILLREAGLMKYDLFHNKKDDTYWIHIKVPSEVVPKFYYDVVIQFYTDDNAQRTSSSLTDYNVRFFSNDPAFTFTYLRVFLKNGMFIEPLKSKSSKQALTKDPVEKNPYQIPGYVKSIFFAFLYMKAKSLFIKDQYVGKKLNLKKLLDNIEHSDKKIADRQRLGEEEAKKKRIEKDRKRKETDNAHRMKIERFNNKDPHRATAIGTTKTTRTIKPKSKVTKSTKWS